MYLHQTPYLFAGSVEKNLSYVHTATNNPHAIQEAMKWAGISHLATQSTANLSGGERQRVALARAWLKHPMVLLLDEPTANLDQPSRQRTVELICRLKQQGVALVIASHDPLHFQQVIDSRLTLKKGELHPSCQDIKTALTPTTEAYA
jgi:tungstate transport system ATP-binding protein